MDAAAADEDALFGAVLAALTPEQSAELRAALDELDAAGPPYATWVPSVRTESGAMTMPYPDYSPPVQRLRSAAAALVVVFPWVDWTGFRDYEDPASLATAPVHDAMRMVTRTLRGERFSDGHLEGELAAGRLQAAIRRILDAV